MRLLIVISLLVFHALAGVFWSQPAVERQLTVGSYNVQAFGHRKKADHSILNAVAKVVCQFDVIGLQELKTEAASNAILAEVNRICEHPYAIYKAKSNDEFFGFYFRAKVIDVVNCQLYKATAASLIRPPYVCLLEDIRNEFKFVYIQVHVAQTLAVGLTEVNWLLRVYAETMEKLKNSHHVHFGFIGGDFNIPHNIHWLKTEWFNCDAPVASYGEVVIYGVQTTTTEAFLPTKDKPNAYDTFIMHKAFKPLVNTVETGVVNMKEITKVPAASISDHLPVKMTFKSIPRSIKWNFLKLVPDSLRAVEMDDEDIRKLIEEVYVIRQVETTRRGWFGSSTSSRSEMNLIYPELSSGDDLIPAIVADSEGECMKIRAKKRKTENSDVSRGSVSAVKPTEGNDNRPVSKSKTPRKPRAKKEKDPHDAEATKARKPRAKPASQASTHRRTKNVAWDEINEAEEMDWEGTSRGGRQSGSKRKSAGLDSDYDPDDDSDYDEEFL